MQNSSLMLPRSRYLVALAMSVTSGMRQVFQKVLPLNYISDILLGYTARTMQSGITITGSNADDFAKVNNCWTSFAAGASCLIGVTFTPFATGARSAVVSVSENWGGIPQQVGLASTGSS